MDESLFTEILSVIKHLKNKSAIINLFYTDLSYTQKKRLKKLENAKKTYTEFQNGIDVTEYGLQHTPSLYNEIYTSIIKMRNLENCLSLSCEYDFKYLKTACLFALYFKKKDKKFMAAGVQFAIRFGYKKLAIFGLKILERDFGGDDFKKLSDQIDKKFDNYSKIDI